MSSSQKTSVEIENLDVVKEACMASGITLKTLINTLIRNYMLTRPPRLSNKYFKGIDVEKENDL